MTDTAPFQVDHYAGGDSSSQPAPTYQVAVSVGEYAHRDLFEAHGFSGNGPSWAEHIQYILEAQDPELLDHLETDEEGSFYVVYLDSAETVERFLRLLRPIFADREKLQAHFSQLDPEEFFE